MEGIFGYDTRVPKVTEEPLGERRHPYAYKRTSKARPQPLNPEIGQTYYDPNTLQEYYWDGLAWLPFSHDTRTWLVFVTPPLQTDPDVLSADVTIERRDTLDNPLTDQDLVVYLYSSDPDMFFRDTANMGNITSVTILDGDSQASFKFQTPNSGNPVITASTEQLPPP